MVGSSKVRGVTNDNMIYLAPYEEKNNEMQPAYN